MHAHSDLKFKFNGDKADIEKVKSFLEDRFDDDVEGDEDFDAIIEETYACVWIDNIAELAVEIVKLAPKLGFVLSGVVDTSESAGEYMDYEIRYENEKLTLRHSCWYVYFYAYDYESYEECVEETEGRYTEEEYNFGIENEDAVVLDSGDGAVMAEAPLCDPIEIEIDVEENGDEV